MLNGTTTQLTWRHAQRSDVYYEYHASCPPDRQWRVMWDASPLLRMTLRTTAANMCVLEKYAGFDFAVARTNDTELRLKGRAVLITEPRTGLLIAFGTSVQDAVENLANLLAKKSVHDLEQHIQMWLRKGARSPRYTWWRSNDARYGVVALHQCFMRAHRTILKHPHVG